MARTAKPWYRKDRKSWFVTIGGIRHNPGADKYVLPTNTCCRQIRAADKYVLDKYVPDKYVPSTLTK